MRSNFLPTDFKVPQRANIDNNYYLMPITTNELIEDWQTLLNNASAITEVRGGGSRDEWPFVCSLEDDYKDLAWLEVCAKYKQLFSYIIRSAKDDNYVGCIYIYPIELFFSEKSEEFDVDFSYWITQSELDGGKYEEISESLLTWLLNEWPFDKKKIYFRNKLVPEVVKTILK